MKFQTIYTCCLQRKVYTRGEKVIFSEFLHTLSRYIYIYILEGSISKYIKIRFQVSSAQYRWGFFWLTFVLDLVYTIRLNRIIEYTKKLLPFLVQNKNKSLITKNKYLNYCTMLDINYKVISTISTGTAHHK